METRLHAVEPLLLGSVRIDERGDIIGIDPELGGMLGWPPRLLTGRSFAVLLEPRDAPMHQAHLEWSLRTGGEQEYETRIRTAATGFIAAHVRLQRQACGPNIVAATITGGTGGNARAHTPAATADRRSPADESGYAMAYLRVDRLAKADGEVPEPARAEVLREIGARITAAFRQTDRLVQSSGHEFLTSLVDVHALVDAQAAVRRLAQLSSAPLITRMGPIRPLISTRIAFFDAVHAA